jgi:hypothetical protein
MSSYKIKNKIWFKITAAIVVCLFLVNSLAIADGGNRLGISKGADGSHLAPSLRVKQADFMEKFKARFAMVSHKAVNNYIKTIIKRILEIKGKDGLTQRHEIVNGQQVLVISIPGLLRKTGQFAHVGLGRQYGVPAIYVDSEFYENEDVLQHEMDEIEQWEDFRISELGISREEMREWILANIEEAKEKAKEFHENSHPLDALYEKYEGKIDFDFGYIGGLLTRYKDDEAKDINIAARSGDSGPAKTDKHDAEEWLVEFHDGIQRHIAEKVPKSGIGRKQYILTPREQKICAEDIERFKFFFSENDTKREAKAFFISALNVYVDMFFDEPSLGTEGKSAPPEKDLEERLRRLSGKPSTRFSGTPLIGLLEQITGLEYGDVVKEFVQGFLAKENADGQVLDETKEDFRFASILRGLASKRPLLFIRLSRKSAKKNNRNNRRRNFHNTAYAFFRPKPAYRRKNADRQKEARPKETGV